MNSIFLNNRYFNVNERGNYNFSLGGREVLCLNKRIVELGVGASIYASYLSWNQKIGIGLDDRVCALGGFIGLVRLSGYRGLGVLLVTSTLLQVNFNRAGELSVWPIVETIFYVSIIVGQSMILLTSAGILVTGLAFLIKEYGFEYINALLDKFNNQQNTVTIGAVELKDNIKYHVSVFGRDVLCLKKTVLQVGSLFGIVLAAMDERTSDFLIMLSFGVGLYAAYRFLGDKIYGIYALFMCLSFINPSQYLHYLAINALSLIIIGEGLLIAGIGFQVFALLSYLVKKSGNKQGMQIAKYLDSLRDKQKVKDYDVYIKDQKTLIEKRLEFIRDQGNASVEVESFGEELKVEDVEIREIKAEGRRLRKEDKGKTINLRKNVVNEKKVLDVEVKREYKVNLSGKACRTTWSQLFDNTKSMPDNLVVQGSHVKTLIEALGGSVVLGNINQIYFSGKFLGSYEVAHGKDKKGCLTSKYANRVKRAIEKAIESGYISEGIVKVAK